MNIAYNPLSEGALSQAPSDNDILFDLPGKCIYARGVKFKGTDTIYQVFKKNTSSQGGGYNGLVPAPNYQESNSRYLREDGKWIIPESQYRYQSLNNTDLDTLRTEGRWYYIAGSSNNKNGPDKFNEGSELYVGRNSDGYRYQKIIRTSGEVWLRIYNGSTWGAWKRWYVDGEVKQTSSTSDTMKPLVLGYTDAKNTSDLANSVINQVHVTTSLYANPKSGTLVANIFKGQLQGTIASNTTATTQQQTDNSTKVATTAFVRVAIANLVNGAPETLDTLKEIANYLQDGSVAGGIVQQLAKKVNKTGDTMSGDLVFQDVAITSDKYPFKSAKLHWSGGSDFASIYYAVTSSNIGKLVFEVGDDGSEEFIWRSNKNGDYVTLNNTMLKSVLNVQAPMFIGKLQGNADSATKALSADKLTTSRTLWGQPFNGTQNVTGNITVNGNILNVSVIQSSDSKYVDIKSPNYGIAFYSKGSLKAVIENSGNFGIGTPSPSQKLHVVGKALSDGYMKNGSSDSYVLLGGGGHKALSNLANATDLSKYVPLTQPNTIYTSGTTPYNYVYLFRIANSSGYSTAMADIEIKVRYGRIRLWVDIRTPEHPYGDGDNIYITKEPWSNNWSSKRIWYKRTQVTSGYNYYDVYLECGAQNSGQYGIVQKGGSGLIYEPKGQNLDSLPSGCTEVQYRSIDAATLSGWTTSNFYNEFTGNRWYHLYIDNSNTTGSTWYKVCSVKFTGEKVPAYLARKINGYLYDSKSNWYSNSTEIIPFQIVINLSDDTATIYSTVIWNSSKLRVLKIGTRNYEIQFSTSSNYLDSNIYYTLEGDNTYVTCYTKLEQATSGSTYITSCSQLNSYGNNSYHSTSSDTATTANKLGSSTIGSATVPIYLNAGSPKACSSTSAATANTIAVRDGSGDLLCRLVRANYADQNTMSGGIVFRINNSGDNYLRCCNNPSAVRSWLGIGSSGDYVTALGTIGNNLTWTKNGTTNNIIIPYATNSGKVANSLVLKFNSGTTEGTNLYTFNGSSGKTIDIRPGSNVQFATTSGTVVISSTNTTYSQATSSTLGLVKIGYGEDGKNYPVELNGSGQMYVNVPWTDNNTTYTAGTNLTLNGNKFSVKVGSTNAGNRVVGTAQDGTIYESEALTSELQYLLSDWSGTTGIMTLLGKKQDTITGGATTITSSNLTASRVLVSNSSGKVAVSSITSAELGYLDGVTSGIQTQINSIKYNWLWYQEKSSGSVTDNPGSTYGAIINGNCPKDSVLKGVHATYNDTNMSAENLIADNANTIITIKSSSGNYFNQLMIAQRGRLFTRSFAGQTVTETKGWNVVPLCSAPQIWNAYQDFRGGAGNSGSDMRFKKEVQNVGNILSKINDLNVIKYIWEHPDESQVKYTFGIDANKLLELGGIFATMVHSRNDKHDTKWVEYDRFGVLAIKAIQELCQTIQQMKNRIEILENKICLNSI